jgi:peptidoglycan/LPS O-acetylase OafA/YrhL
MQNMRYEDNLYGNPIMGLVTGSFSVAIFFVLSGFVLSVGFFAKRDDGVIKRLASKRYLRLMLPALAAILLAYIIMQLGLDTWRAQTAAITHSSWLTTLWPQTPNFFEAVKQGVYGIFVSGGSTYNPVLWTVKLELIGSFIVFGVALLFSNSKYRWFVYLTLGYLFFTTWYLGFIVGMVIADLVVNKKKYLEVIPAWALIMGAMAGVGLGAFPPTNLKHTLFESILIPGLTQDQNMSLYLTVGATLVILATILVSRLKQFFSHKRIAVLGKYTFALYLIHMPILFTVGAGVFVASYRFGLHEAVVISMFITLLVLIPAVYLFERYIDAPSIKLSSYIADIYNGKRTLVFKPEQVLTYLFRSVKRLQRTTALYMEAIKVKYAALRTLINQGIE